MTDMIMQAVERIQRMEFCFDGLSYAVKFELWNDFAKEKHLRLKQYYESGEWLKDYELDEKGLLPANLKRGVLSQDALYDLLSYIQELGKTIDKKVI